MSRNDKKRIKKSKSVVDRVRAKDFKNHVDKLGSGRWNGFEFEYGDLQEYSEKHIKPRKYPSDYAQQQIFNNKNRYNDVFPYDEKRIKLQVIEGVDGSDYINASWVGDYPLSANPKAYICSQGPQSDETVFDFWRMVLECKVKYVVMLTLLFEEDNGNQVEKCSKYWPESGNTIKFNDVEVHTESIDKEEATETRYLKVTRGSDSRNVVQIHFQKWLDRNVPADDDFSKLLDKVDKLVTSPEDAPMLVHCTAGVGRSGVFCLIRSYIKYLKKYVDENKSLPDMRVARAVYEFRKDRMGMIQNALQYEFVYKFLRREFENLEEYAKTLPQDEKKTDEKKTEDKNTDDKKHTDDKKPEDKKHDEKKDEKHTAVKEDTPLPNYSDVKTDEKK